MHELSLAKRMIEELGNREFTSVELDVGIVSIHDNQRSKDALKKMLADSFPRKKIKINFLPPQLSCACGHTSELSERAECEKCGKKTRLELNEGYRIRKMEK